MAYVVNYKLEQALKIHPPDKLAFRGPFDHVVTESIRLTNPTNKNICFKILTTAPRRYCVRPNAGIIRPHELSESAIMLQPNNYDESELKKHKLMVKSMYVPDVETDERVENLWKGVSPDDVMATKIACTFIQNSSTEDWPTDDHQQHDNIHRPILVASIDIGNTCTKFAFSFRYQYENDPTSIWTSDLSSTEHSIANPTVVLFDDTGHFDSFGYDAVARYEECQQWHIFRDIKQPLYQQPEGAGSIIFIKDGLGKKKAAVDIIREIIKHIKDHLNTEQERQRTGIRPEDIYWVLTVPAVFTVYAVSTVKRAAIAAGIAENKVRIITEAVSALEYCHIVHKYNGKLCTYHDRRGLAGSVTDIFSNENQLMVVDIGGETLDVTVLERNISGNMSELHKVCGVGYGGSRVQKALDNVLTSIVGPEAYHRFQTEKYYKYGYNKMQKDLNNKLADEGPDSEMNITITLPELIQIDLGIARNFKDALKLSPYAGELSVIGEKLRLSAILWKGILADYCLKVVEFMKSVCRKMSLEKVTSVLLVGGYAKLRTIQEALLHNFPDFKVFIPPDPQIATVHGAVILGHNPTFEIDHAKVTIDSIVQLEDQHVNSSDSVADDQACGSDFVQSMSEISLSSDSHDDSPVNKSSPVQAGLTSLKQRMKGKPQEITLRRGDIVADVIAAYGELDVVRPIRVRFVGEDTGDMTKEMFGFFWEKISSVWFRGENAVIPLVPVSKRAEARRIFPVLGKVLEHMLCILGQFPPQISRSLILAIAHQDKDVDADLVLEDYLLFLPERENELLVQSLGQKKWSEHKKKRLERFFNLNKISLRPSPDSFKEDLLNIAYSEIIDTSHIYTTLIGRGFSDFAKTHFFSLLDVASLKAEYKVHEASSETVAQMVEAVSDSNEYTREEKVIINYLSNFISDMSKKQLRRFLLWLTGSANMPQKICIKFNVSLGMSKVPIPHRDRNTLELPGDYSSYQDFERIFMDVLLNEFFTPGVPVNR